MAPISTSILLLAIALASTNALEARKVLNIPEKIIGGVIDIVQSHKNKPSQQVNYQQSQLVYQQAYPQQYAPQQPWNTNPGFQSTTQTQNQGQYSNYVYPQNGNYQQSNYVTNSGQQFPQGQYPVYPQGSYQTQTQTNLDQSNQFQSQGQTGFQGQNGQFQVQNQQTGQYQNTNQQSSFQGSDGSQQSFQGSGGSQQSFQGSGGTQQNFQGSSGTQQSLQGTSGTHHNFQGTAGTQNFQTSNVNQQTSFPQNQPTTGFGGQNQGFGSQSNYGGQTAGTTYPQASQTGFGQQTSQFQGTNHVGSTTGSGGFQVSTGHQIQPGPTCVCQTWAKPQEVRSEVLDDSAGEKSVQKKTE